MSEAEVAAQDNENAGTQNVDGGQPAAMPVWLIPVLLIVCIGVAIAGEQLIGRVAAPAAFDEVGRYQRIFFPPPHGQLGDPPEWLIEVRVAMMKNNSIGYGIFGAILLGAFGAVLGIGYPRRNPIVGLIIGALTGLLMGAILAPISYYIENRIFQIDMEGAIKAAAILGLIFLGLGTAGAFLAAILGPAADAGKILQNGILAAVFVFLAYILFAIAVFPIGFPESTYPHHLGVRYSLFICYAICPVLAAVMLLRGNRAGPAGG